MSHRTPPRTDTLFEALLRPILSGELPVGSRLPPERQLAETHGTNRNTLREAIRRLEQLSLVSVRQGQGVTVRDWRRTGTLGLLGAFLEHGSDVGEKARVLLEMLPLRRHLAEMLVATAAERATDGDLERLRDGVRDLVAAERARDGVAYGRAQTAWLDALVDATHSLPVRWTANPLLSSLEGLLVRQPSLVVFEPRYSDFAADVQAALTTRDPAAGVEATRRFHEQVDAQLRQALLPLVRGAVSTGAASEVGA